MLRRNGVTGALVHCVESVDHDSEIGEPTFTLTIREIGPNPKSVNCSSEYPQSIPINAVYQEHQCNAVRIVRIIPHHAKCVEIPTDHPPTCVWCKGMLLCGAMLFSDTLYRQAWACDDLELITSTLSVAGPCQPPPFGLDH